MINISYHSLLATEEKTNNILKIGLRDFAVERYQDVCAHMFERSNRKCFKLVLLMLLIEAIKKF